MSVILLKKGDSGVMRDGSVVAIKQDDWIWGRAENDTELFVKVTVRNAPVDDFVFLNEMVYNDDKTLKHFRKNTINYTTIADINNSTLDEIQRNLTVRV